MISALNLALKSFKEGWISLPKSANEAVLEVSCCRALLLIELVEPISSFGSLKFRDVLCGRPIRKEHGTK